MLLRGRKLSTRSYASRYIFADIGSFLSIDGIYFSFSSNASPSLSFGVSLEFDANSVLAKNIGFKEILLNANLTTTPNCILLNLYLYIALVEINIREERPASPDDMWYFTLVSSYIKVTFRICFCIKQPCKLNNKGMYSLKDYIYPYFIIKLALG